MTPRQQRFVEEYLKDPNATQAAIRAGYSKKTAEQQGPRLLGNVGVAAAIQAAQAARSKRTGIDADWVLARLARLAEVTVADFLTIPDGAGQPRFDLSGATPEQLAAIEGLQLDTHREKGEDGGVVEKIKLTLPNKLKTLELMGKHVDVQAYVERKEVEINIYDSLSFDEQRLLIAALQSLELAEGDAGEIVAGLKPTEH